MAQYVFNPEDYNLGDGRPELPLTIPGDWDTVEIKADSGGAKYLHLVRNGFNFTPIVFDDVPVVADAEVYLDTVELASSSSVSFARGKGATRINASGNTHYSGGHNWNSLWVIRKRINGSSSVLASGGNGLSTPRRLGVRFLNVGQDLKVKVWQGAPDDLQYDIPGNEPATWTSETTDSSISSAGSVGMLFVGAGGTDQTVDRRIYFAGVGTNGDSAPTGPVPVGPTTPTSLITSNITVNSFRAGWTP